MSKIKAALIHALISVFVIGILTFVIYYIWYPKPFATIAGVIEPLKLLLLIDVVIGPMLTFIVYKNNKKHLLLDLSLIAIMQITALSYGAYIIYGGRPSMLVLYNGEFHYLTQKFSNHDELQFEELKPNIFSKPKMAYISNTPSLDIYGAYGDMLPIDEKQLNLLQFSLNSENMKAKFKGKVAAIETISQLYINEDIVYFNLDKDLSKYFVVYSNTRNTIVDYLEF